MLDYAGMKYLYAVEIAANFDALPAKPSKDDVQYLLKREGTARNHSRVGDMIDLSGELQTQYRDEWLRQYKPYRLTTAMARWDAGAAVLDSLPTKHLVQSRAVQGGRRTANTAAGSYATLAVTPAS